MTPLSRTEFLLLLERQRDGDPDARLALVQANTGLVRAIAHRFARPPDPEYEDIVQAGYVGLLKAIDLFDESQGTTFATYAFPVIAGEIRRYLRGSRPLKVARSIRETARRLAQAREGLAQRLCREPTVGELASEVGVELEQVLEALEAAAPMESIDEEGGAAVVSHPDGSDEIVERMSLRQAVGDLKGRERAVIALRFGAGLTQAAVARRLGVSQPQVSREEKAALVRLRQLMS